jgi:hypothetical protein
MRVRPTIYKIYQVRASGRVVLQGKCGSFLKSHLSHLTPCHLANIDSTVDVTLQRPDADKACEACRNIDDEQDMLLCDNCGDGWHTFCLTPPLDLVPSGIWLCPACLATGVDTSTVEARIAAQQHQQRSGGQQEVQIPTAPQKRAQLRHASTVEAAQQLEGRYITKTFKDPVTGRPAAYKGRLSFRGAECGKHLLLVRYEDGDEETMGLSEAQKLLLPEGGPVAAVTVAIIIIIIISLRTSRSASAMGPRATVGG